MAKFETICSEAAKLFARDGIDKVAMRDVADASGVTVAAIYYHFSSKDELYEEVARMEFERFMSELQRRRDVLGPGKATPSQVAAIVYDVVLEDSTLFVLTQRDLHRCDGGDRYVHSREQFGRALLFLRETLERFQQKPATERDVFAFGCVVTGYCEYVHADARFSKQDRTAFITEQREGLIELVQRAFEAER